jgi:protein-S-isoprenylcysteine O-methyltransferase Ste14
MILSIYNSVFLGMWLAWAAYWWVLSGRAKATERRESLFSRLSYMVPLLLAGVLLFLPILQISVLNARFLPLAARVEWGAAGAVLNLAGLLLTVWARVYLGGNWSGTITIKEDHELITGGPYRLVRHPIYTGLLLAFIGVALARGEWRGILGVLIAAAAFWRKLRIEERWMRERFGDKYQTYSQRVSALIPFVI